MEKAKAVEVHARIQAGSSTAGGFRSESGKCGTEIWRKTSTLRRSDQPAARGAGAREDGARHDSVLGTAHATILREAAQQCAISRASCGDIWKIRSVRA